MAPEITRRETRVLLHTQKHRKCHSIYFPFSNQISKFYRFSSNMDIKSAYKRFISIIEGLRTTFIDKCDEVAKAYNFKNNP